MRKIYETCGVYLGYSLAQYIEFYLHITEKLAAVVSRLTAGRKQGHAT